MATTLSSNLTLPVSPAAAYEMVTDPAYLEAVAIATGGNNVEVSVTPTDDGGAVMVSRRSLPADLPSYAKAVVGDTLRLTEIRSFGAAAADGSRHGRVSVTIEGAPITIEGPLELRPTADGSIVLISADIKAAIPFVGGKLEQFALEQMQRFLRREQTLALERLA